MSVSKVYSPTQAAMGALLGGPVASAYFIKQNFSALDEDESVKKSNFYGSLAIVMLLEILPFLPENFPKVSSKLSGLHFDVLKVVLIGLCKEAVKDAVKG